MTTLSPGEEDHHGPRFPPCRPQAPPATPRRDRRRGRPPAGPGVPFGRRGRVRSRPERRPAGRRRRHVPPRAAAAHPLVRDAVGRGQGGLQRPELRVRRRPRPCRAADPRDLRRGRGRRRPGDAQAPHPGDAAPLRRLQPADRRHPVGPDPVLRHHLPVVLRPRRAPAVGRARRRHPLRGRHHHPRTGGVHALLGYGRRPVLRLLDPERARGRVRRRHQARGDGALRADPRAGAGLGPGRPAPLRVGGRLRHMVAQRGRPAARRPGQPRAGGRGAGLAQHRAQRVRHLHRGEPRLLRSALPGGDVAHLRAQRGTLPRRGAAAARGADQAAQRGAAVADPAGRHVGRGRAADADGGRPRAPVRQGRHTAGLPVAGRGRPGGGARGDGAGRTPGGVPGVSARVPAGEVLGRAQVRAGGARGAGHQLSAARVAAGGAAGTSPVARGVVRVRVGGHRLRDRPRSGVPPVARGLGGHGDEAGS